MGRQGKDYARVLGLLKEPTEEEVKRAFRRLALKYHPDKVFIVGTHDTNLNYVSNHKSLFLNTCLAERLSVGGGKVQGNCRSLRGASR